MLIASIDSAAASSDNDNDETMEDVEDADADGALDGTADGDGDIDNEANDDDNDDDDDTKDNQDSFDESPSRPGLSHSPSSTNNNTNDGVPTDHASSDPAMRAPETASPKRSYCGVTYPTVRPETITAPLYDIVPTIASPHSTSINTVTATPDMRWVFSGGADGWIRKFNWVDTANAKSMLTVAQRHPFVDSVTKAGVLMSYWENEEPSGR